VDVAGARRCRDIGLDEEQATSAPVHAECQTDLDLERRPWGRCATHDRVRAMAARVYTSLRHIGRVGLIGAHAEGSAIPPSVGDSARSCRYR
jgi:hypothetical protein